MSVLVVDDDAHVRRILTRVLTKHGRMVTDVADAREALGTFNAARFSFAFLDVDLGGGFDGIALAQRLREMSPGLHIVMMSGDPRNAPRIAEAGLGPMLAKPFNIRDINPLLESAAS